MGEMKEPYVDCVCSRKEAARMLGGCSIRHLRKMEERGELQPIQISPRIIGYRDSALRQFIHDRTKVKRLRKP
jgi:DNA-binding transcriptional MerR regulator